MTSQTKTLISRRKEAESRGQINTELITVRALMEESGVSNNNKLKLYSYWISSCSFRVRFALNLKGLKYEYVAVHLHKGEQYTPEFSKLNPMGFVPVVVDGDIVVSESFAILMYLEEKFPQHPLLPRDLQRRAINYQVANIVCSSIQPHQLIAQKEILDKFGPDEGLAWAQKHSRIGFAACEKLLKDYAGRYATGDEIFLADIFLAPQIHAAVKRFKVDMTEFPLLLRLHEAYGELPAFQDATPEKQPDAPASSAN